MFLLPSSRGGETLFLARCGGELHDLPLVQDRVPVQSVEGEQQGCRNSEAFRDGAQGVATFDGVGIRNMRGHGGDDAVGERDEGLRDQVGKGRLGSVRPVSRRAVCFLGVDRNRAGHRHARGEASGHQNRQAVAERVGGGLTDTRRWGSGVNGDTRGQSAENVGRDFGGR